MTDLRNVWVVTGHPGLIRADGIISLWHGMSTAGSGVHARVLGGPGQNVTRDVVLWKDSPEDLGSGVVSDLAIALGEAASVSWPTAFVFPAAPEDRGSWMVSGDPPPVL
jgi:hypothetical protein